MTGEEKTQDELVSPLDYKTSRLAPGWSVTSMLKKHKRAFFTGVLIIGPALGLMIAAVTIYVTPREFLGRNRIAIAPAPFHFHTFQDRKAPRPLITPTFLESQIQIITSQEALSPVIDEFQLNKRWKVPQPNAISKLVAMLEVKEVEGTDLIDIEVHSTDPVEAADLANAIGRSYQNLKTDAHTTQIDRALDMLKAQEALQEQKVEDSRQNMIEIMEKHEIVDLGEDVPAWAKVSDSTENGTKALMEAVRKMEPPKIDLDTLSADSLLQSSKDKVEIEALRKAGLGENHPAILSIKSRKAEINRQLAAGVETVRAQLEITERMSGAQYLAAKRDYETQNLILTDMRNALLKEKIDLSITPVPFEIHELAEPAESPSRPKVAWILLTGFLGGGLVLGLPIGIGLIYLSHAFLA